MSIYSIKPYFQKILSPISNLFIRFKISPTIINLLALFISLIMGVFLFFLKDYSLLLLGIPFLALIRTAFNALDGMVARGLNLSSKKGEVYNEIIDRISDIIIFLSLSFGFLIFSSLTHYILNQTTIEVHLPFVLGMLFLPLLLLNSYLGILGKSSGGKRIYSGIIGKADRMFYLSITSIIYIIYKHEIVWSIFFILMIMGTIISILQRFIKTIKDLEEVNNK